MPTKMACAEGLALLWALFVLLKGRRGPAVKCPLPQRHTRDQTPASGGVLAVT